MQYNDYITVSRVIPLGALEMKSHHDELIPFSCLWRRKVIECDELGITRQNFFKTAGSV